MVASYATIPAEAFSHDNMPTDSVQGSFSPTSSDVCFSFEEGEYTSSPLPTQSSTYLSAVVKGYRLLHLMQSPSPTLHFFPSNALHTNGYTTLTRTISHNHTYSRLLSTLTPSHPPSALEITSRHKHPSLTNTAQTAPATNAEFTNIFDLEAGVIIAGNNFGPKFTSPALQDGEAYPDLQHWSDVIPLQLFQIEAGAGIKNLKAVVRYDIENNVTNHIVHEVMRKHLNAGCMCEVEDQACPECGPQFAWPGVAFEVGAEEALALLGTPNGCGVAWLLGQHRALFGRKVVKAVTVWCNREKLPLRPSLLFSIEDDVLAEGSGDGEEDWMRLFVKDEVVIEAMG